MPPEQIWCDHFARMIYPAECVTCSGKAATEAARITVTYVFKARYSNYMRNDLCEHWVAEGESIHALSNGYYVCAECAEGFEDG